MRSFFQRLHDSHVGTSKAASKDTQKSWLSSKPALKRESEDGKGRVLVGKATEKQEQSRVTRPTAHQSISSQAPTSAYQAAAITNDAPRTKSRNDHESRHRQPKLEHNTTPPLQPPLLPTDQYPKRRSRLVGHTPSDRPDKFQHARSSSEPAAFALAKDDLIPYPRVAHTLRSNPLEERSNRETKLASYLWSNEVVNDEARRTGRDSRIDQRDNDVRKRTADGADRRTRERAGEEIESRIREKSETRRREKRVGVDEIQETERADKYSSKYRELDSAPGPSRRKETAREDRYREREEQRGDEADRDLEVAKGRDRVRATAETKDSMRHQPYILNGTDTEVSAYKRSRRERKEQKRETFNVESTEPIPGHQDVGRDPHRTRREAPQSDTKPFQTQQLTNSRHPRPEEQDTSDSSPFHSSDNRRRPDDHHPVAQSKERHPPADAPIANGTTSYALNAYAVPQSALHPDDERRRSKRQSRSGKPSVQAPTYAVDAHKAQSEYHGRVESSAPLSSRLDGYHAGFATSQASQFPVAHSVLPISIRAGQGPADPPSHEGQPKTAPLPTGWASGQAASTATHGRTSVYQPTQPAKHHNSQRLVPVQLPDLRTDALPNPVVLHPIGVAVTDTAGSSNFRYTKYDPSIMAPHQQHFLHTLPEPGTHENGASVRGILKPVSSEKGHRKRSRKVHSTDDRKLVSDAQPAHSTDKNGTHSRGQSLDRGFPPVISPPLQLLSVSQNTDAAQHKTSTNQSSAHPIREPTRSGLEHPTNFIHGLELPLGASTSRPSTSDGMIRVSAANGVPVSAEVKHIGSTLLRPPSSAALRPETEKSRRHHKESSKEESKRISPTRVHSQLTTQPPSGDPNRGYIFGAGGASHSTESKSVPASQIPYVTLPEQPLPPMIGSASNSQQHSSQHTPQQIIHQASTQSTADVQAYIQQLEWRPQSHTREPNVDGPPPINQRQDSTKSVQNAAPIAPHPAPPTPPYQIWTPARDHPDLKLLPDTQPSKTPFRPDIRHKGLAEVLSSPLPKDLTSNRPSPTTLHTSTPTVTNFIPPNHQDVTERNPQDSLPFASTTSTNPVNVAPITLPEVQTAPRIPPSPLTTSHLPRKPSESPAHLDTRTSTEGRGKYSPAYGTPRPSPNMDTDQKTPTSPPSHNSSWSRRRGTQALQEQAHYATLPSTSRVPTSIVDPTHPYQTEVAVQIFDNEPSKGLSSPMPRVVRIHPDQYPLAIAPAEPTSQPVVQPSKMEHSSQNKPKKHIRDSSGKNHSPPNAVPGLVSSQKPQAASAITPPASHQILPPKFATSPMAIPLSRIASDESGLRTPSSLAMSSLQPTVSRSSLPEGRSWGKGGLLNKLLSRASKPEANPTPEIVVASQAKQTPVMPQTNGGIPGPARVQLPSNGLPPASAIAKPQSSNIFTPFKYLRSKRNRSMSAVSLEAQDGTATNTIVGSPTASMHSQAPPIIQPPFRDPLIAADEWTRTAEVRKKPDGKTRRPRPGVTFDISEEDSPEAGRRPKPTRSKKRSSTSTTTTPQDNPKHP